MTGQPEHVVIVGAGLGGLRTAQQLRSAGLQGRISLVGAESRLPYDRPPLSKQVLTGEWEPARTALAGPETFDELGVRAHLGNPAVALRPGDRGHELELADGATLHGDAVVIATGLVARELPGQPAPVHTLRTLDDALALRATLETASSLLVVGAGFIGAEVASSARTRGAAVTVVEALDVPAVHALGPQVGAVAGRLLTEGGAELHTGATITRFTDGSDGAPGRVTVELADGRQVAAEAAVVGIGGVPDLGWLAGLGLDTSRGLPCGPTGRVHGLDGVWAVGDVASWDDPVTGGRHRHEHWTSAGDQAAVVARDVLAAAPPPPTVPYCWSDQFGLKIQILGRPELGDEVVPLHGAGLDGGPVRGTVAAYVAGDRVVAVAGFGAARLVARYRPLVASGARLSEARETAASLS
ncbi:NAD(P)/FAD-dependent oxidoreductase [Pseudonocardia adelaidensis]|uniref:FAD/NAD(P)-binding oxidoreductase n=1 Tax=Pseudonocardia adelaidensis TaxID=648754 RepID=A0ABP9NU07_9PSEU